VALPRKVRESSPVPDAPFFYNGVSYKNKSGAINETVGWLAHKTRKEYLMKRKLRRNAQRFLVIVMFTSFSHTHRSASDPPGSPCPVPALSSQLSQNLLSFN
jgi:hypothetical protein